MKYAIAYALAARNAKACEESKEPRCRCACGGRFHGAAHSPVWVAEYAAQLAAPEVAADLQLDLDDQK